MQNQKRIRSRQGSNLRGKIPLDFKSNALTTRPRLLSNCIIQLNCCSLLTIIKICMQCKAYLLVIEATNYKNLPDNGTHEMVVCYWGSTKRKRQSEGASGFEPETSRSAVECSTTELYPRDYWPRYGCTSSTSTCIHVLLRGKEAVGEWPGTFDLMTSSNSELMGILLQNLFGKRGILGNLEEFTSLLLI